MSRRKYYLLIGSLPALPPHFELAEQVPISRLRLQQRLRMLDEEAAATIEQMSDFLAWDRQPLDRTDEEVIRRYDAFVEGSRNSLACRCIEDAMTLRTVVSAVRRRRLGSGPPPGVGPVAEYVARHWSQPHFRLEARLPWIVEVEQQLNSDQPFQLERTLLNIKWRQLGRLADQADPFSFEALVLYLIRWEMVDRWTSRDAVAGRQKFDQLVADALGPHRELFDTQGAASGPQQ